MFMRDFMAAWLYKQMRRFFGKPPPITAFNMTKTSLSTYKLQGFHYDPKDLQIGNHYLKSSKEMVYVINTM